MMQLAVLRQRVIVTSIVYSFMAVKQQISAQEGTYFITKQETVFDSIFWLIKNLKTWTKLKNYT